MTTDTFTSGNEEKTTDVVNMATMEENSQLSTNHHSIMRHWKTSVAVFSAALGSCALGTAAGYSSPAFPDLNSHPNSFQMSTTDISIATSIIYLGAVVGLAAAGGFLVDRFGRKRTLMYSSLPLVAGWLLIAFAPNVICIHVGRFLTGLICGISDLCIPMYISEISEKSVRGFMATNHDLFINVGTLFAFALGIVLHWYWLAIACAGIPVVMFILLLFVPESPRWLLSHDRKEEAIKALFWLRGSTGTDIEFELKEVEANILAAGSSVQWREFRNHNIYKPICILVCLMFFMQMTGGGVLTQYMESIFKSSGSEWNPSVQTAVVGVAGLFGDIFSALVVDRAGRRMMMTVSAALLALTLAGLASYFTIKHYAQDTGILSYLTWLPLTSLLLNNFSGSLGFTSIPGYLASELLPLKARSRAGAIISSSFWIFGFITSISFEQLCSALDMYVLFWIFCGFIILGGIFSFVFVMETKGLSLEEIEARGNDQIHL